MPDQNVISLLRPAPSTQGFRGLWQAVVAYARPLKIVRGAAEVTAEKEEETCSNPETWNAIMPIPFHLAVEILKRDLPAGALKIKIRASKFEAGNHVFIDRVVSNDEGYADLYIFPRLRKASYCSSIYAMGKYRGIGRILMRNQIEYLHAIGSSGLNLRAGSTLGGYVHARTGFCPDRAGLENISEIAKQRYMKFKPFFTAQQKAAIEPLLGLNRPQDIWRMADCREYLSGVFNRTVSAKDAGQMSDYSGVLPAGRFLLAEQNWDGSLNFSDVTQMRRAENYLGGFKYIGFI